MVQDIKKPDLRSSVRSIMEAKKFAKDAVREFLLFRGFTDTLQSFESELHAQYGTGFYLLAMCSYSKRRRLFLRKAIPVLKGVLEHQEI